MNYRNQSFNCGCNNTANNSGNNCGSFGKPFPQPSYNTQNTNSPNCGCNTIKPVPDCTSNCTCSTTIPDRTPNCTCNTTVPDCTPNCGCNTVVPDCTPNCGCNSASNCTPNCGCSPNAVPPIIPLGPGPVIPSISPTAPCNNPSMKDQLKGMPLAMAYVPWQPYCNLYCASEGFQHGTIFKDLDLDFLGRRCN